eukprot:4050148-Pleurochrysis_carterae.AAC.2
MKRRSDLFAPDPPDCLLEAIACVRSDVAYTSPSHADANDGHLVANARSIQLALTWRCSPSCDFAKN